MMMLIRLIGGHKDSDRLRIHTSLYTWWFTGPYGVASVWHIRVDCLASSPQLTSISAYTCKVAWLLWLDLVLVDHLFTCRANHCVLLPVIPAHFTSFPSLSACVATRHCKLTTLYTLNGLLVLYLVYSFSKWHAWVYIDFRVVCLYFSAQLFQIDMCHVSVGHEEVREQQFVFNVEGEGVFLKDYLFQTFPPPNVSVLRSGHDYI